jgi:hypothetical protein
MKRDGMQWTAALGLVLLQALGAASALGQPSGGGYEVRVSAVAGGGGGSAGFDGQNNVYWLNGTAGQADAGAMAGRQYRLGGGLWAALGSFLSRTVSAIAREAWLLLGLLLWLAGYAALRRTQVRLPAPRPKVHA